MRGVVVFAAVGCGAVAAAVIAVAGRREDDRRAEVSAAISRTLALPSARVTLDQSVEWGLPLQMSAQGVLTNKSRRLVLTMRTKGYPMMREVFEGTGVDTTVSNARSTAPTRPWQIFAARKANDAPYDAGAFVEISDDLPQVLRIVRDSASRARRIGRETLRGAATTRYRVRVVLGSYDAAFPHTQRDVVRAVVATLERDYGLGDYDVDVWVGSDNLVRRLVYTLTLAKADIASIGMTRTRTSFAKLTSTFELSKAA